MFTYKQMMLIELGHAVNDIKLLRNLTQLVWTCLLRNCLIQTADSSPALILCSINIHVLEPQRLCFQFTENRLHTLSLPLLPSFLPSCLFLPIFCVQNVVK